MICHRTCHVSSYIMHIIAHIHVTIRIHYRYQTKKNFITPTATQLCCSHVASTRKPSAREYLLHVNVCNVCPRTDRLNCYCCCGFWLNGSTLIILYFAWSLYSHTHALYFAAEHYTVSAECFALAFKRKFKIVRITIVLYWRSLNDMEKTYVADITRAHVNVHTCASSAGYIYLSDIRHNVSVTSPSFETLPSSRKSRNLQSISTEKKKHTAEL